MPTGVTPSKGGVTNTIETAHLVEEEAQFQKTKEQAYGPVPTGPETKIYCAVDRPN